MAEVPSPQVATTDPTIGSRVSEYSGPVVYCAKHGTRHNTMCVPCFRERSTDRTGFERGQRQSFWRGFFSVFGLRQDSRR